MPRFRHLLIPVALLVLAAPAWATTGPTCEPTDRITLVNGEPVTERTPEVAPDAAVLISCSADADCAYNIGTKDRPARVPYGTCHLTKGRKSGVCECHADSQCRFGLYQERACVSDGATGISHCSCSDDWQCPSHHLCNRQTGNCYRTVSSVELGAGRYRVKADGTEDATCQLRQAIHDVDDGGTLHIPTGLYALNGQIEVNKSLRIVGDGFFDGLTSLDSHGEARSGWGAAAGRPPLDREQIRRLYGTPHGYGGSVLWALSPAGGLVFDKQQHNGQVAPTWDLVWLTGGDFMLLGDALPGSVGLQTGLDPSRSPGGQAQPVDLSNVLAANFEVGFSIYGTEDSRFDGLQAHGVGTGLVLDGFANGDVFTNTSVVGFTGTGIDLITGWGDSFKDGLLADARLAEGSTESGVGLRARLVPGHDKSYRIVVDGFDFQQSGVSGKPNVAVDLKTIDGFTLEGSRFSGQTQCVVAEPGAFNVKLVDLLLQPQLRGHHAAGTFVVDSPGTAQLLVKLFDATGRDVTRQASARVCPPVP